MIIVDSVIIINVEIKLCYYPSIKTQMHKLAIDFINLDKFLDRNENVKLNNKKKSLKKQLTKCKNKTFNK